MRLLVLLIMQSFVIFSILYSVCYKLNLIFNLNNQQLYIFFHTSYDNRIVMRSLVFFTLFLSTSRKTQTLITGKNRIYKVEYRGACTKLKTRRIDKFIPWTVKIILPSPEEDISGVEFPNISSIILLFNT